MLGLGLQINKNLGGVGGKPPFSSDLSFWSKKRNGSTVINKLDVTGDSDGKLVGASLASFNGIDNSINFGNDPSVQKQNFIGFAKIKTSSTVSGTQIIISKGRAIAFSAASLGWVLSSVNGSIRLQINNDTQHKTLIDSTAISPNTEYNIIFGYNNGFGYLKVDDSFNSLDIVYPVNFTIRDLWLGRDYNSATNFYNGCICNVSLYDNFSINGSNIIPTAPPYFSINFSEGAGLKEYDVSGNANHGNIYGDITSFWQKDLTTIPYSATNGCSKITVGGDIVEVPALLGTQFDALNGDPLTNPATSKIVSNVDGYIILPDDIKITVDIEGTLKEVGIFDRSNPYLYTDDARNVLDYLGAGYEYYWRIDKLNTANILSWMQPDYKFSWFVKNTFTVGTFDAKTIKEILAYNAPITGADNLSKLMKYLGIDVWYDSQTWDDTLDWID